MDEHGCYEYGELDWKTLQREYRDRGGVAVRISERRALRLDRVLEALDKPKIERLPYLANIANVFFFANRLGAVAGLVGSERPTFRSFNAPDGDRIYSFWKPSNKSQQEDGG